MKFFKHLWLVCKHRHRVLISCIKLGIPMRGLFHDLSKFSPSEFFPSVKYYQGFQSPLNAERKAHNRYSYVFNHHTGRNKHHWEYWVNYYRGDILLLALPYKVCLEFIADMIAASKTYNGKNYQPLLVYEYWMARREFFLIHSQTKVYIDWLYNQYCQFGFKGLSKNITKEKYQQMFAKIDDVERYRVELHKLNEEEK